MTWRRHAANNSYRQITYTRYCSCYEGQASHGGGGLPCSPLCAASLANVATEKTNDVSMGTLPVRLLGSLQRCLTPGILLSLVCAILEEHGHHLGVGPLGRLPM